MLKKIKWLLSLTVLLSFISCGGGSSKEAKELLERLLRVVGIPYNIVVNICQDDNNNGFCESIEIQAKLNINKNDSAKDIWEKLQLSSDGSYLLAHHDPTKNIIMEIQDQEHLKYNNGMLSFFYNPLTQELSILQALVDSGYLRQNEITTVQAMDNRPVLDKVLLNSLFYNQNILIESNLSVNIAMSNNFAYLAKGLRELNVSNQLPRRIDQCNRNQACIDTILNPTSLRLEIDNAEVTQIVQNQDGESSTNRVTPYTPEILTGSDSGAFKVEESESRPDDSLGETTESNASGGESTQPTPTDNNASNDETTEPTPTDNNTSNDETTESTPTTSTPIGKTEKNGADGYIVKLSSRAYATCDNGETYYSDYKVGEKGKLTFNRELTDDCLITIPRGATIDSNNNGKYNYADKTLTFDMKAFANADFITPLTTLLVLKKKNGEDTSAFEAMVKSFDPVEASNRVATQSGVEKVTTQKLMLLMEVLKTPNLRITNMGKIDISDIIVTSSSESIKNFNIDKLVASLSGSMQSKAKERASISQELTMLLGNLDTNKIDLATFMTNISDGGIKIKSAIRGAKHQGMFISDTNTIGDIIKSSADRSSVEATLARLNRLLNNAPTAHAGRDQTVTEGVSVVLSGSLSSDIDNDIVDYLWKDGDMPIGNGVSLTKSDFSVGTHTITLVVTDEEGVMASDDVVIVVNEKVVAEPMPTAIPTPIPTPTPTPIDVNQVPITNAGEDKTVAINETLIIRGSGIDSDGTIVSYEWRKGDVVLATTPTFDYLPTVVGIDTLVLTVTDDDGATDSDSVVITVIDETNTGICDLGYSLVYSFNISHESVSISSSSNKVYVVEMCKKEDDIKGINSYTLGSFTSKPNEYTMYSSSDNRPPNGYTVYDYYSNSKYHGLMERNMYASDTKEDFILKVQSDINKNQCKRFPTTHDGNNLNRDDNFWTYFCPKEELLDTLSTLLNVNSGVN